MKNEFVDGRSIVKKKSFNEAYSKGRVMFVEDHYFTKREFLSTEKAEFEGKIINQSVYKIDDPASRYKGLTASQFALENQIELGVEQHPVKCNLDFFTMEKSIVTSLKK